MMLYDEPQVWVNTLDRRNGSASLIVVAVASVALVVAFVSLHVGSAHRQASELEVQFSEANVNAWSAMEAAIAELSTDPNWATNYANHQESSTPVSKPFDSATLEWYLQDLHDGDVGNNQVDPLRVVAMGKAGDCRRNVSVMAFPSGMPLEVLRCSVHATGEIVLRDALTTAHGPVSSNTEIDGNGYNVVGSVEAPVIRQVKLVSGGSRIAAQKVMPSKFVFQAYKSIATFVDLASLTVQGELTDQVIDNRRSPSPSTDANVNGVYHLQVPSGERLDIENCKITGTLLVELLGAGAKLRIHGDTVWKPLRSDFPSLIVYTASDDTNRVDINNEGTFDLDGESCEAQMEGVFHVIRDVESPTSRTRFGGQASFRGCLLADGKVVIASETTLRANHELLRHPVVGYQRRPSVDTLVENGGFEKAVHPWYGIGSTDYAGGTRLTVVDDSNTGGHGLLVSRRVGSRHGVAQEWSSKLESGKSYNGTLHAKMGERSEELIVELEIKSAAGITRYVMQQDVSTNWTPVALTCTPIWEGDLEYARLLICTGVSNQDFQVDDVDVDLPADAAYQTIDFFPSTYRLEMGL